MKEIKNNLKFMSQTPSGVVLYIETTKGGVFYYYASKEYQKYMIYNASGNLYSNTQYSSRFAAVQYVTKNKLEDYVVRCSRAAGGNRKQRIC